MPSPSFYLPHTYPAVLTCPSTCPTLQLCSPAPPPQQCQFTPLPLVCCDTQVHSSPLLPTPSHLPSLLLPPVPTGSGCHPPGLALTMGTPALLFLQK